MKPLLLMLFILAPYTASAADTYFPKGTVNDFEQAWFGQHLAAMKEPVLTEVGKDKGYFVFRILYLPTWGRPVAIRFEKHAGHILRRSVMLSGDGGYEPGQIKEDKNAEIKQEDLNDLVGSLDKAGFWTLPAQDGIRGLDGSELVVEAVKDGKYLIVDRWAPESDKDKRDLAPLVDLYSLLFQQVGFWKKGE